MKLSKDRILTTHVGSLPRSEKVFKLIFAKEDGKNIDKKEYDEVIAEAVSGKKTRGSRSRCCK